MLTINEPLFCCISQFIPPLDDILLETWADQSVCILPTYFYTLACLYSATRGKRKLCRRKQILPGQLRTKLRICASSQIFLLWIMAALLTTAVIQWSIWVGISVLLFAFDVFWAAWRQSYQQHTHRNVDSHTHPSISRYNTIKYLHNLSTAAVGLQCLHFPNGNLERMFFDDCSDVTTLEFNEWERFYRNYAQGKKAINFFMFFQCLIHSGLGMAKHTQNWCRDATTWKKWLLASSSMWQMTHSHCAHI